jgi:hypothetical protein
MLVPGKYVITVTAAIHNVERKVGDRYFICRTPNFYLLPVLIGAFTSFT